jgi:hypothetical protein
MNAFVSPLPDCDGGAEQSAIALNSMPTRREEFANRGDAASLYTDRQEEQTGRT